MVGDRVVRVEGDGSHSNGKVNVPVDLTLFTVSLEHLEFHEVVH